MNHHDLKHHTIRTLTHVVVLLAPSSFTAAQHSDVEFGPDGPVFEADFPTSAH